MRPKISHGVLIVLTIASGSVTVGVAARQPDADRISDWREAIRQGDELTNADPGTPPAWADALYRRALELVREGPEDAVGESLVLHKLAGSQIALGEHEHAESLLLEALLVRCEAGAGEDAETAEILVDLGNLRFTLKRPNEGLADLSRALAIRKRKLGDESAEVAELLGQIGVAQRMVGDPTAAEASLKRAIAISERRLDDSSYAEPLIGAIAALADLYEEQNRSQEAARWRQRLNELLQPQ